MELTVIIGSILRHGITALGAYLVTKGYIEPDAVAGFVEAIVGGVLALGGLAYSVYRTKKLKS